MSLVAYDAGSSSEEESEEPEAALAIVTRPTPEDGTSLDVLPAPKPSKSFQEEEDDEFLHKKETPTEKPPPKPNKGPVKIMLPSLNSFKDDDDEDEERRPRFEPPNKGTGLLGILPRPKCVTLQNGKKDNQKATNTSFVPRVLSRPPQAAGPSKPLSSKRSAPRSTKSKPKTSAASDDSDDASDAEEKLDFFALDKKEEPLDLKALQAAEREFPLVRAPPPEEESYSQATAYDENPEQMNYVQEPEENSFAIEEEALKKLRSNRERRKGEEVTFIDIDQSEILPDSREWMTKALTEDPAPPVKRLGDGPGGVSKRKHQITYLAHQAKANEQALQNQWAQNRLSRKQTQSKYGF